MAALPSPTQVAGTHSAIYEAYYHQVDPNGTGAIQALDAARFLKKSRLSDVVLSKIWDLSDPTGKGYLDKPGLFVALKLVALAQTGKDISMNNVGADTPPPKVGDMPKPPPPTNHPAPSRPAPPSLSHSNDWSVKPAERDRYNQLFDSLQPSGGLLPGAKVKGVLMESKLPLDTLSKIWELADQDMDGMLDRHEFMVAMHLVYKGLEKRAIPTALPPELRARPPPPAQPARPPPRPLSPLPPAQPALLDLASPPAPNAPPAPRWVVSAAEAAQFDAQFALADQDRDGFVSGHEIRGSFLRSGLPQPTLAHVWALCDTAGAGKLSRQQFALAMWLIARALQGEPPPPALAPDMLPPESRGPDAQPTGPMVSCGPPAPAAPPAAEAASLGPQPTPELEAIAREVDALARERLALEAETAAKQRQLAQQAQEALGLQSELDTLTATLKQLENQKGEAQKRLNDLKTQVEKLRAQAAAAEASMAETEAEVGARRAARDSLRERERALRREADEAAAAADGATNGLRRTVLAVSQATIKLQHLQEQLRLMDEACAALQRGGAGAQAALALAPAFGPEHLAKAVRGATPHDALDEGLNGGADDAFAAFPSEAEDPFAARDSEPAQGFSSDPFASSNHDPFASSGSHAPASASDGPWEADPFAVLHAPTRAPPSPAPAPSPALPPKQKAPPPRPAPPRPLPPHKSRSGAAMEFTEDPFKDYRYEDPFNIEDPFADVADPQRADPKRADPKRADPFNRPTSVAGFETDDFFPAAGAPNGTRAPSRERSGRVSAPPASRDPFGATPDSWAPAWPDDAWGAEPKAPAPATADVWASDSKASSVAGDWKTDNWADKEDGWANKTDNWANKTDNWANKADNWAAEWSADRDENLNETWPTSTLPAKKEKAKPVKYARSLVHTLGGMGRRRDKAKAREPKEPQEPREPSEEQQWAWAAAESQRLQLEAAQRQRQEDAELQLALALSRRDK